MYNNFLIWLNTKYGSLGKITSCRGDNHNYLGMTIMVKGEDVTINMKDYVRNILNDFPIKSRKTNRTIILAGMNLFSKDLSTK